MSADITTIVIEEHQLSETEAWLSLNELCECCGLEPPLLIELVDIGLITPSVVASDQWRFRTTAVPALHQALRLRRELELDWQGVAVAMDLMAQLRELRQQVDSLQRQLGAQQVPGDS